MNEAELQRNGALHRDAAARVRKLGDVALWGLEESERARIGPGVPLNGRNQDHFLLMAANDEHARRKGNRDDD